MMTKALTSYAYCEIYAANYMEPEIIRAPPPPPQPILLLYPLHYFAMYRCQKDLVNHCTLSLTVA